MSARPYDILSSPLAIRSRVAHNRLLDTDADADVDSIKMTSARPADVIDVSSDDTNDPGPLANRAARNPFRHLIEQYGNDSSVFIDMSELLPPAPRPAAPSFVQPTSVPPDQPLLLSQTDDSPQPGVEIEEEEEEETEEQEISPDSGGPEATGRTNRKRGRDILPGSPETMKKRAKHRATIQRIRTVNDATIRVPTAIRGAGEAKVRPSAPRPLSDSAQMGYETFAVSASERVVEPVTDIDWRVRLLSARRVGYKYNAFKDAYDKIGDVVGTRPDIFVVTTTSSDEANNFPLPTLHDVLRRGDMPIFVNEPCLPDGRVLDAPTLIEHFKRTNHGELLGKTMATTEVSDAESPPPNTLRQTSMAEFELHMLGRRRVQHPLNWLDLMVRDPGFDPVPAAIRDCSLNQIVAEMAGGRWEPDVACVASTKGSISPKHIDTGGPCVALIPTHGRKDVYLVRGGIEEALRSTGAFGALSRPPADEYVAVSLDADADEGEEGYIVLGPGQVHWVNTVSPAIILVINFYTAATFAATLRSIRAEWYWSCESNEDEPSEATWDLLLSILDLVRDRSSTWQGQPIFTSRQRAEILTAATMLVWDAEMWRGNAPAVGAKGKAFLKGLQDWCRELGLELGYSPAASDAGPSSSAAAGGQADMGNANQAGGSNNDDNDNNEGSGAHTTPIEFGSVSSEDGEYKDDGEEDKSDGSSSYES